MKKRIIAFCMAIVMLFSPLEVSAADEVVISPADLLAPALEDADLPELEEFGADHGTDTQILPLLASGEALVYLASCLGLTAATALILKNSGLFSEWSSTMENSFYKFCANAGIASATAVSWLSDVAAGTLDKTNAAYKAFKDWISGQYKASQIVNEVSNAKLSLGLDSFGITTGNLYKTSSVSYYCGYNYFKLKGNGINYFLTYSDYDGRACLTAWSLTEPEFEIDMKKNLTDEFSTVHFDKYTSSAIVPTVRSSSVMIYDGTGRSITLYFMDLFYFLVSGISYKSDYLNYFDSKFSHIPHGEELAKYVRENILPYASNSSTLLGGQALFSPSSSAISQRWEKTGTLDDIDIQIGNDADAQVVDIPWQNVIDQYGSISAQLDSVQEGLISLDEAISAVGAQVVDKTTDEVIAGGVETDKPAEDSKPDEGGGSSKPEQKPAAYALDLTKYFPFCLPFDLYEFFTLLIAEPEAPKFDFQLDLTGVGLQKYTLTIDLKVFDSVASIVRTTELLLFIGSLITATRAMFIRS